MSNDLTKFSAGNLDTGVDIYNPDFTAVVVYHKNTRNVTTGISRGVGPRYGITPIPGQADFELISPTSTRTNGLRFSEFVNGNGLINRTRAFKIIPITRRALGPLDNATSQQLVLSSYKQFLHLLCGDASTIDVCVQTVAESPGSFSPAYLSTSSDISQGWDYSCVFGSGLFTRYATEFSRNGGNPIQDLMNYPSDKFYISAAAYIHPSKKVASKWLLGKKPDGGGDGDATHAPDFAMLNATVTSGVAFTFLTGEMSCLVTSDFDVKQRPIMVFELTAAAQFNIQYSYLTTLSSLVIPGFKPSIDVTSPVIKFLTGGESATKITAGVTYTDNKIALVNDDLMFTDAAFSAIFIAGSSPVAMIFQDWERSTESPSKQYFSLTLENYRPLAFDQGSTLVPSAERYQEDTVVKNTAFLRWPQFITGTAMSPWTADGPTLGAADSGILRKNSVYEISYSYYNKRLDFESNVGDPVRVQTGDTDDNVCIILCNSSGNDTLAYNFSQFLNSVDKSPPIWPIFSSTFAPGGRGHFVNFTEIRFYYRELGTFDWLPAGSFDAAEFWFRPNPQSWCLICSGAVSGLPGGQPGGFNDYSPLPKATYNFVLTFQNRVFWFGDQSLNFSYRDNPFAYPLRNTATVQTGKFLGAIIHNFPGQAQQTSRLVIFATSAIYVGRFTGDLQQTAIQISPDTTAQFPLDGSDFTFDLWTTVTAFSARAAANAEGTLYYWGPDGIFRDNGTETPDRISKILEPEFFTFYDQTKTNEIFATFNTHTREIIWFYTGTGPGRSTYTDGLVYNIETEKFLFVEFNCKIDDASEVPLNGDNSSTFGFKRTIVSVRSDSSQTVQRMYFFDYLNRAGDMTFGNEIMIKSVSTPTTGQRRFTFATNTNNAANIGTINVGDYICVQQLAKYWPATTGSDFIGTVAAKNAGSGYLDIILPSGLTFDASATLTYPNFFPLMHKAKSGRGLHGIDWNIETKYWLPAGVNFFAKWLWVYWLMKYNALPKTMEQTLSLAYRTPDARPGTISDIISFVDNSDANFQLYHALRTGNLNNQGQALKLILSGVQIGEEWVMNYLEAHVLEEQGNVLKQYQG